MPNLTAQKTILGTQAEVAWVVKFHTERHRALFELRPRGRTGIRRAFYCFLLGKKVVVLHAFIKKSQQTPDSELKMARKRLKEVKNG